MRYIKTEGKIKMTPTKGYGFALLVLLHVGAWAGIPEISTATAKKNLSVSEIYKRNRNSVVLILSVDRNNTPLAIGSGFYARDDNVVITNEHVVRGGVRLIIRRIGEDKTYPANVLSASKRLDLAALRLAGDNEGSKSPPMELQTADNEGRVAVGEPVIAIGNPRGLEGSVSTGIVSGFRISNGVKMIQITAPISPGSSGGPVLNSRGVVIGVATATLKGGQNLNFAVPATYISDVLNGRTPNETTRSETRRGTPERNNAGLILSHYSRGWCDPESFSVKNANAFPVKNVLAILLYYNAENGEPIENKTVHIAGPISPGMAKMTTWHRQGIGQAGCKFVYFKDAEAKRLQAWKGATLYDIRLRILDYEISEAGSGVIETILGR